MDPPSAPGIEAMKVRCRSTRRFRRVPGTVRPRATSLGTLFVVSLRFHHSHTYHPIPELRISIAQSRMGSDERLET